VRILIITDLFPPVSNAGAERTSFNIATAFRQLGHDVQIITTSPRVASGVVEKTNYENLDIYQVGSSYDLRQVAFRSMYNVPLLRVVKRLCQEIKPDVIHVHNIHIHISYGVFRLARKLRIPSILTCHDAMSVEHSKFTQGLNPRDLSEDPQVSLKVSKWKTLRTQKFKFNPFRNAIIRRALSNVDGIVTVSNAQRELLAANCVNSMMTIHNGIPTDVELPRDSDLIAFRIKHGLVDTPFVLWAGRLTNAKGASQVATAMLKLWQSGNQVRLLLAGKEDAYVMQLKQRMANAGFADRIVVTGWLDVSQLMMAYRGAVATLNLSICFDMFPTVVLESMLMETPPIAGCFGGAKESIINGRTGYVVNPFNIDSIAERILKLVNEPHLRREMGELGRQRVIESFDVMICANEYLKLFADKISGNSSRNISTSIAN
jgi:glycosyltransferase involved in cell wall biosynthesis